jgi:hypothetical protein
VKPNPETERAFKALCEDAKKSLNGARDEFTRTALAAGEVPPIAICVALAMAGINVAALAIIAGEMDIADWDNELRTAIEHKRAGIAARERRKLQ